MVQPRILCVDDEARVLEGLESVLDWDYRVATATSASEGILMLEEAVRSKDPFSVVISDMRMPKMDGATFLSHVYKSHPTVTRVLLTGYSDLESAMKAVNQGAIFRMLLKPCPADDLHDALSQATKQHDLMVLEQNLLDETLKGAVSALMETLSLASPMAFSRANSVRRYVEHIAKELERDDAWMFEVAAMVTQLGYVSVPDDVLERYLGDQEITDEEREMVESSAKMSPRFLEKVPRLEPVVAILHQLHGTYDKPGDKRAFLGAKILALALEVDKLVTQGVHLFKACDDMNGRHEEELVEILRTFSLNEEGSKLLSLEVAKLGSGMLLESDVYLESGQLLVRQGQVITLALLERLRNFHRSSKVKEPILVRQFFTL